MDADTDIDTDVEDLIDELLGGEALPAPPQPPAPRLPARPLDRDRIRGMLLGAALGDALGAPHEFGHSPLERYTGAVEHRVAVNRRFQGGRLYGAVGQITDDTEMSIALARAIVRSGGYSRDAAVAAYLSWANSKCPFLGTNTRELFVGVKTPAGYERRAGGKRALPQESWSQSNGCLMRAAPLAALPDAEWEAAAAADCRLSNPHPVCVDAVIVYLRAARALLRGATPAAAIELALASAATPEVAAVIAQAMAAAPRRVGEQKGWVLHATYCAFLALGGLRGGQRGDQPSDQPSDQPGRGAQYQDLVDLVVRLGGDTDTNAAIAGALLGAAVGERAMRREARTGPNLELVLGVDPSSGGLPRPTEYAAAALPALADALADLAAAGAADE